MANGDTLTDHIETIVWQLAKPSQEQLQNLQEKLDYITPQKYHELADQMREKRQDITTEEAEKIVDINLSKAVTARLINMLNNERAYYGRSLINDYLRQDGYFESWAPRAVEAPQVKHARPSDRAFGMKLVMSIDKDGEKLYYGSNTEEISTNFISFDNTITQDNYEDLVDTIVDKIWAALIESERDKAFTRDGGHYTHLAITGRNVAADTMLIKAGDGSYYYSTVITTA